MRFHYMGKYNLDSNSLPTSEIKPNSVKFKEPDEKQFAVVLNIIVTVLSIIFFIPLFIHHGFEDTLTAFVVCGIISYITMFPHELLHSLCLAIL